MSRRGAAVVAVGAISALGRGREAYAIGAPGEPAPSAIAPDPELQQAGLPGALSARVALGDALVEADGDRARALLSDALGQVCRELDALTPGWRDERVGICLGTSSGGMTSAERFFAERHRGQTPSAPEAATYFAPLDGALADHDLSPAKRCQVVAACASSTLALGLGSRWLERGACDLVLAGGYDGLAIFVAAGFAALRATTETSPRPFREGRDGMVLGEGAAVLALRPPAAAKARWFLTGFGASADANHITAPEREGRGLERAGRAALADAGEPRIDLVSAHGTSTPYNDSAEARAIGRLGPGAWVHPYKAQIGHCLGAAGVLEVLALARALEEGVVPAAAGLGPLDPDARVPLAERTTAAELDAGLKLSAAFGGVCASLVLAREPNPAPVLEPRRVVLLGSCATADVDRAALAEQLGIARDRLARIDDLGQLAIAAVAALARALPEGAFDGAGIVGGYALATLDTNERFDKRRLDKGPRRVDPRLFPATSPNAGAGHGSIFFGLTGPCFAVNRGLDGSLEALEAAAELVARGDVDRMIVVAADDAGPASLAWRDAVAPGCALERGAVALLVGAAGDPLGGERAVPLAITPPNPPKLQEMGQLLLRRWLTAEG